MQFLRGVGLTWSAGTLTWSQRDPWVQLAEVDEGRGGGLKGCHVFLRREGDVGFLPGGKVPAWNRGLREGGLYLTNSHAQGNDV